MSRRVETDGKSVEKLPGKSAQLHGAPEAEFQEIELSPDAREFQLGVLLVHGIGTPRAGGDTLVHWGDVLLKTIARATRSTDANGGDHPTPPPSMLAERRSIAAEGVLVSTERAGLCGGSSENGRFEAVVRLSAGDHTERWLLREGLWAGAFPAPSYRELLSWSVRALPWSIVTHFGGRYWQAVGRATRNSQASKPASNSQLKRPWYQASTALARAIRRFIIAVAPRVQAVFLLIVALALTPALITLLGLTLLLGLAPVPQIRNLVLSLQSKLTATVGDSFAFVESPIRAGLMRECILDGLKRLKPVCEQTVVIAHSQGAAVVLDALGAFEPFEAKIEKEAVRRLVPDALITFGAGTNQLASQKVLADRMPTMERNPVRSAVWAILGTAGLLLWLYWRQSVKDILWAGVFVILFFIIQYLLSLWRHVGSSPLEAQLSKQELDKNEEDGDDSWKDKYLIIALAAVQIVILLASAFLFHDVLPFGSVGWLMVALFSLFGSIKFILSSEGRKIVQAPVSRPVGLRRWIDLYASADLVPNGPTRTVEGEHDSKRIWNLHSLFADHTAYWDNRDGFVLRVARVCAETAGSPWTHKLPKDSDFIDKRAAWRVGFLRVARWSSGLAWLALGISLWIRHQGYVPSPINLPSWIPAQPVEHTLFVAFIVSAICATSAALYWIWSWWVWAEQEVVMNHELPGRESDEENERDLVIFFMALIPSTLITAVIYMVTYVHSWADLSALQFSDLTIFMIASLFFAGLCAYLLSMLKCRPPDTFK